MKYPWIDEYLMSKRSVTKDLQPEWNWIRYHIGGKNGCRAADRPAKNKQQIRLKRMRNLL